MGHRRQAALDHQVVLDKAVTGRQMVGHRAGMDRQAVLVHPATRQSALVWQNKPAQGFS